MPRGQASQVMAQGVHISLEQCFHHKLVADVAQLGERQIIASATGIDFLQLLQTLGLNKDTVHRIQEVVAGGALDGPFARERLATAKNFFNDNVAPALTPAGGFQPLEKTARIPQAVDMIDAQSRYFTVADQGQS